jgi:hypothetical protein
MHRLGSGRRLEHANLTTEHISELEQSSMSTAPDVLRLTPEEFLAWELAQSEKHEYLDGFAYPVYAMVGARGAHVTVAGNVFTGLRARLRGGAPAGSTSAT